MRSVLVTGGTRRIGAAIADRLRADGWRVVVSSHRPDSGADVTADLSAPDGADALFSSVRRLLGGSPPDAIVNNAAAFPVLSAADETLNLASPVRLAELLADGAGGDGRDRSVVNVVDSRVLLPGADDGTRYWRLKADLLEASFRAAAEYLGRIRVNCVAPGPVLAPERTGEKAGPMPFGRPAASSVADAVAYLLCARHVTGAVIPVDGGRRFARTDSPS